MNNNNDINIVDNVAYHPLESVSRNDLNNLLPRFPDSIQPIIANHIANNLPEVDHNTVMLDVQKLKLQQGYETQKIEIPDEYRSKIFVTDNNNNYKLNEKELDNYLKDNSIIPKE